MYLSTLQTLISASFSFNTSLMNIAEPEQEPDKMADWIREATFQPLQLPSKNLIHSKLDPSHKRQLGNLKPNEKKSMQILEYEYGTKQASGTI